jgi:predicted amidohydrolase YtcJ
MRILRPAAVLALLLFAAPTAAQEADLGERLATPGFIDNHTHFDQAGALLLGVNLLDVETALQAYTVNNAYAAGEEDLKGSIAPGKLADLVVLERDIFRIPAEQIKDVRVVITVLGGRIVHEADVPGP